MVYKNKFGLQEVGKPQARIPGARHMQLKGDTDKTTEQNKEALVAVVFQLLTEGLDAYDAPSTLKEAQEHADWPKWREAMQEEMDTLKKMGTWKKTDLPLDRKPITCQWVYALKRDSTGAIVKNKARLVAWGFSQEYGIDYKETFAPVIRLDALLAMLALAAIKDWDIQQLDIKGAYLHGDLEEEIYMEQPPYFNDQTGKYCKLIHSLCGLKQSG